MKVVIAGVTLVLLALVTLSVPPVLAAARPVITIVSPHNGATITGTTVRVSVAVRHFRLVPPVLKNPPILKGVAGHIQYLIDGSFTPRDITTSLVHDWTGVPPGRHTITAMLATGQHVQFPDTRAAQVTVLVRAPAAARSPRHTTSRPAHHTPARRAGGGAPHLNGAPTTGGAAGLAHSSLNVSLLLAGILALLLGIAFLTRRFMFAAPAVGATPGVKGAVALPNDTSTSSLDVMASAENPDLTSSGQFSSPSALNRNDGGSHLPAPEPAMSEPNTPSAPEPARALAEPATASPDPVAAAVESPRERAIDLARQWNDVIDGLVRQIDQGEAERQQMLEHIRVLEERVRAVQAWRDGLRSSSGAAVSAEDFQSIRYVTESLMRDPDHIVVLAAVAQHADKLQRMVESYAQLRRALEGS